MRIRVLGAVELQRGTDVVALRSVRLRRLLAALTVCAGEVVSVDRLADIVWGEEQPAHAEAALHSLIARLRRRMADAEGPSAGPRTGVALLTRPPGYVLAVASTALDAACFGDLAGEARRRLPADPARAAQLLDEALGLWRGPAYAEFADDDFARPEAARLEQARAGAVEDRVEAALALGDPEQAVARLEGHLAEQRLRERPHGQLVLALYRAGRQADALEAYRSYRDRLADELGLEPSEDLRRLEAAVLRREVPPAAAGAAAGAPDLTGDRAAGVQEPAAPGNLPPPLRELVGREELSARVGAALGPGALVTLTGPGGVGKTSLALECAARVALPDGAWWCDLAGVGDPDVLADVVATVLGVRQRPESTVEGSLLTHLRGRRLLLVLDNCEHLVGAAARLAAALSRGCRHVTVLATSRERLGVQEEVVVPLPPLPLPAPGVEDATTVGRSTAVQLFVRRASAAAGLELADGNAAAVAELCRRLDGLPLALELAASRMTALGPAELAQRLHWRFRVLRGGRRDVAPRHRTLRAVIDWSYELLGEQERCVFDRLAVFPGDFTLEAAERVVAGAGARAVSGGVEAEDVADVLARLVDCSMVTVSSRQRTAGGEAATRYVLLESMRAYGRERLEERAEASASRRAHAEHVVGLAEAASRRLHGPEHGRHAQALVAAWADLRAAHEWALAGDRELALRLVAALAVYADVHLPAEVFAWAERTVEGSTTATGRPPLLARAYAVVAAGARYRGDLATASSTARQALALTSADDPARRHALYVLSDVALFQGHLADADRLAEELVELPSSGDDAMLDRLAEVNRVLARAYAGDVDAGLDRAERLGVRADLDGDPVVMAWSRYALGEVLQHRDPQRAGAALREALARARDADVSFVAGAALVSLASLHARGPGMADALPLFREVIGHWYDTGSWTQQWTTIRNLVPALAALGLVEEAAVLRGAVTTRTTGAPVFGEDEDRLGQVAETLARALGPRRFQQATARGAGLSDDDVVRYVREALDRLPQLTGGGGRSARSRSRRSAAPRRARSRPGGRSPRASPDA